MSSRAFRKLHGDADLFPDLKVESSEDDGEEDEVQPVGKNKKAGNLFDLLQEEANDVVSEEENVEPEADNNVGSKVNDAPAPQQGGGAKKKKKKKKKKQKQGAKEEKDVNKEEEDIDATIREVNELLGPLPNGTLNVASGNHQTVGLETKALLIVEHRFLNPENEMKKIFGAQVVKSEQRRRGRNRQYHRATWMTSTKPDWPHMGKTGLSMISLPNKAVRAGYHYFAFEHSRDYQQVQFKFLDAVASMNPNNIAAMLQINPYHIDSLLQLSDMCKMQGDAQMATDFIERALYCFESSFHSLFNLTQGNVRLEYCRPENRSFYIAIFRHLMFVGQRGCNRTALEYCKLLLCLDPDSDPLGTLLMIDYYALKSEQYSFLIRLFNEWEAHRNLSQLPNFAFSIALAHFHSDAEDKARADDLLQNALIMFPSVLMLLLDKCSIQPDPQVSKHPFFGPTNQINQPAALNQLVALFVGRNHALWKEPEVVTWLENNVKKVLEKVDKNDRRVKEFKTKRETRYQGAPRNIYRHIIMAEIKDATVNLPPELAGTPVMSYDPLPPRDSFLSYIRPQRQAWSSLGRDNNVLSEFVRSLMPNYLPPPPGSTNTGDETQRNNDDIAIEGAIGGYLAPNTDMRQGIGNLMDAMRGLLQTLPQGQGAEEEEVDDEFVEEFD